MKIEIFCDGSATVATKPGGYGWVLVIDDEKHSEGSGAIPNATNNDAELEAAIQGLAAVFKFISANKTENPEVTLISDSQIILNWASGAHRFKQKTKMHKYNALRALVTKMKVKTRWIKGHSGDEYNSRCDKLANAARKNIVFPYVKKEVKSKINTKKSGTICLWHKNVLKIVDLSCNIIEDHNEEVHGKRESYLELK
jgi:ribonuclease HI